MKTFTMRKCTRECIEQFVDYINYRYTGQMSDLVERAIAYALYLFLDQPGKVLPPVCYRITKPKNNATCAGDWYNEPDPFKLSDSDFIVQSEVMDIYDFAHDVCTLIRCGDVRNVFFTLIDLIDQWGKAEHAEPPPTEWKQEEDEDGDDNGF